MLPMLEYDWYKYTSIAVMLLAILFAYWKGRDAVSASSRSLAWTHVPLIAFAIASLGPSAFAVIIYLGYKFGLVQPPPSGYRFSTYILDLPFDFAVINWGFVALYVICRLWPNFGWARPAMWISVAAMSIPNVLLFSLAWTMVSNVFDAGQGIGVVEAMLIFPIIALDPDIFDVESDIGFVISALLAPTPVLGIVGWLVGRATARS